MDRYRLAPDFATWTLAHALPAVGCPSLAIHGDDDEFGSERHPQLIADHASGQVEQALLSGWAMFRIESNRNWCWSGSNGSCSGSVSSLRA